MIEASCPAELDGRALLHSSFSTYSMTGRTGRYAQPTGVLLTIFAAPDGVKTDGDVFRRIECDAGERVNRAGVNANPACPAGLIHHGTCFQRCVGEYRGEADPGPEGLGQQQAVLSDPPQSCQMSGQFV